MSSNSVKRSSNLACNYSVTFIFMIYWSFNFYKRQTKSTYFESISKRNQGSKQAFIHKEVIRRLWAPLTQKRLALSFQAVRQQELTPACVYEAALKRSHFPPLRVKRSNISVNIRNKPE